MNKLTLVLLAILGLAWANIAQADTIQVLGWQHGKNLGIQLQNPWLRNNSVPTVEFDVLMGGESFIAYCADPYQSIGRGSWEFETTQYTSFDSIGRGWYEAAWLVHNYAPGLGKSVPGYNTRHTISALQASVWETIWDTDHSVTSGNFKLTRGSAHTLRLVDYMLATIPENIGASDINLTIAAFSPQKQDLILAKTGTTATPEPGTMILMGTALAGFGLYRRRKRKT